MRSREALQQNESVCRRLSLDMAVSESDVLVVIHERECDCPQLDTGIELKSCFLVEAPINSQTP
jgi:hypothetical protein